MTTISYKTIKQTRKNHFCCYCTKTILKGVSCDSWVNAGSGNGISCGYAHLECGYYINNMDFNEETSCYREEALEYAKQNALKELLDKIKRNEGVELVRNKDILESYLLQINISANSIGLEPLEILDMIYKAGKKEFRKDR